MRSVRVEMLPTARSRHCANSGRRFPVSMSTARTTGGYAISAMPTITSWDSPARRPEPRPSDRARRVSVRRTQAHPLHRDDRDHPRPHHAGLLPTPPRTPGGCRAYNEDAVARLRFVRSAQALGPVPGRDRRSAAHPQSSGPPCGYVTELLNTHIHALETRIGELSSMRDELRARLPPGAIPDAASCRSDQICYLID